MGVPVNGEGHRCPIEGCESIVPSSRLMCAPHWMIVPRPLKRAVLDAWNHGDGAGTPEHRQAMSEAASAVERALRARR